MKVWEEKKRMGNTIIIIFLMIVFGLFPLENSILVVNGEYSGDFTNIAQSQNNTSSESSILWSFATALRGFITTPVLYADLSNDGDVDSILFGTTLGVNILDITNGQLINYYKTKAQITSIAVTESVNDNGYKYIVFSMLANREENILVIDSQECTKLWGYKPTTKVYTDNLGWQNVGTLSWSVDSIVNNDDNYVLASSWRSVFKFHSVTGEQCWEFTATDDVWSVKSVEDLTGDGERDVIAGSQKGFIYLLDGIKGKKHWEKKLTRSYTKKLQMGPAAIDYTIDRSVWGSELIEDINGDSIKDIIVGAEDGNVFALSGTNGEVLWKFKCMLISKPTQTTGFTSSNFFNMRVQVIGDINGDKLDDIAAISRSPNGKDTIHLLSSEVADTNMGLDNANKNSRANEKDSAQEYGETQIKEENRLISQIESPVDRGVGGVTKIAMIDDVAVDGRKKILTFMDNTIAAVDIYSGNVSNIYFENDLFRSRSDGMGVQWVDDVTGDGKNELILSLGLKGILLMDFEERSIIWDYLNIGSLELKLFDDVTGDGVEELLIEQPLTMDHDEYKPPRETETLVRALYLFDKIAGKVIWKYSIPLNNVSAKGFRYYTIEADMTGDDILDIVGYSQDKNDHNSSRIILLDGVDGTLVWSKPPSDHMFNEPGLTLEEGLYDKNNLINRKIKTLAIVNDRSGDEIPDVLVGGEESHLYLLNGYNGGQIWEVTNNHGDQSEKHEVWFDCDVESEVQFNKDDVSYEWVSDLDGVLSSEQSFNGVLSVGEHIITLTVEDGNGNKNYDRIAVTTRVNDAPVFQVRDDQHLKYFSNENCNIWLESRNFDGSQAAITWTSNMEGEVGFGQNLNTYLMAGEHTITVNVRDDEKQKGERTAEENLMVSVYEPRAVRANFWIQDYDWYDVPAQNEVEFDSNIDYEGDMNNLDFIWYVDDEPKGTIDTLHNSFSKGKHSITLEVSDTITGFTDSCTKYIVAREVNNPKLRCSIKDSNNEWSVDNYNDDFYYSTPRFGCNAELQFDAWVEGEEGDEINYTIDLGDGKIIYNNHVENNYLVPGTYEAAATARDKSGNSESSSITIIIEEPGAPVLRRAFEKSTGSWVGEEIQFDATGSYDIDGSITKYYWEFGDGNAASTNTPIHTYLSPGIYPVKLTITDNEQNTAMSTKMIKIYSPGQPMADMNVWIDGKNSRVEGPEIPYKITTGNSVTFDTSVWNTINGWEYDYKWYLDGTLVENASSWSISMGEGTHIIKLKVTDQMGNSDTVECNFLVQEPGPINVKINQPRYGEVFVGNAQGISEKVKNIDWLPWTCAAYMLSDDEILIAGDGRITSTTFDENELSSEIDWRYPSEDSEDSENWVDENQVTILSDLDNDGVKEVSCWVGSQDGARHEIFSGKTGMNLHKDNMGSIDANEQNAQIINSDYFDKNEMFVEDFNADGIKDAVIYGGTNEQNKLALTVLDGNNNGVIWENQDLFKNIDDQWEYQQYTPAAIIDDYNGDGVSEILVGSTRTDSEGADLRIFDGKNGGNLKTIVYEEQALVEDWVKTVPDIKITQIEDMTGDGVKDMILLRSAGTTKENVRAKTVLEIIDLAEGKCIRSFITDDAEIINNGDITGDALADVILIMDGVIYCLNGGFSVSILAPNDGTLHEDTFTLKWDKPALECEVKVDGISYGYFQDGEAKLTLSSGRHVIQVLVEDEFGGKVSDTVVVNIPTPAWLWVLNTLAIVSLFAYVSLKTVVPYILRKKRRQYVMLEMEKIKAKHVKKTKTPTVSVASTAKTTTITAKTENTTNISKITNTMANTATPKAPIAVPTVVSAQQFVASTIPKAIPIVAKIIENNNGEKEEKKEKKDNKDHVLKEKLELYKITLETAWSDGEITDEEESLLSYLREKYGITMNEHRILETQYMKME